MEAIEPEVGLGERLRALANNPGAGLIVNELGQVTGIDERPDQLYRVPLVAQGYDPLNSAFQTNESPEQVGAFIYDETERAMQGDRSLRRSRLRAANGLSVLLRRSRHLRRRRYSLPD